MDDEILEEVIEICDCGKCEECRNRELALVEGECSCVYEDVTKQDEEGTEYTERVLVTQCEYHKTIDAINLKYDNYRLMEKANINQDLWDECTVVDGIIYTPVIDGEVDRFTELENRVASTEEAVLGLLVSSMKL